MPKSAANILQIPPEITEHALVLSHPRDVARFAQTCRLARQLVYQARDQHLWRRLYLEQPFDDLRNSLEVQASPELANSVDWMGELQRRVYATHLLSKPDIIAQDLSEALKVLITAIRNTPPPLDKTGESKDILWVAHLVQDHKVFGTDAEATSGQEMAMREALRDASQEFCQMWSYLGWRDCHDTEYEIETRNHARAFVYDLRNYSSGTLWGPFMEDKKLKYRVNWLHVASIIKVVHSNLQDLGALWSGTRPPRTLRSLQPYTAPNCPNRNPRDWAGVEGTWRRYVCFMDYRFFSVGNNGPYDPEFFEAEDFQEATRLIELKIHIERLLYPNSSNTAASSSTSNSKQALPIIFFKGTSRGGNGNEADVRGSVRMTPDGYIRWRFVSASIYDGHSQWSSEGVQIGAVGSAAGVVGTWTGAHHEEGDPAGPFWLWKVEDNHPSHMHTTLFA
ncbi:hypothetical protein SCHPADRAFT_817284 [Schizopora paradoxa]|uniref:F-box domain-containing protein n=1 Tax=Schizopora paradoxa TaxID=27342 RepID=A0A0H2S730_9AGAM|nr:hypothetical protein SCHPADRAFT_817284 [Schizopora paradoxa]